MRIDSHVHMPSQNGIWGIPFFESHKYLDFMDEINVDRSVILPLDGLFLDPVTSNNELHNWCSRDTTRLIPFFTFEPRDKRAKDEIRRCYEELGMKGVKLHTWLQGFRPTEDCFIPLAEYLAELGLPVLFHDGTPPYSTPLQIAELARMIPELHIILGHGGLYDFAQEAIIAANKYPNISISMTSLPTHHMKALIKNVSSKQLMFGSDGGLNSLEKHSYVKLRWEMFDSLDITESLRTEILSVNPERLIDRSDV